jgi:hypothetical protein
MARAGARIQRTKGGQRLCLTLSGAGVLGGKMRIARGRSGNSSAGTGNDERNSGPYQMPMETKNPELSIKESSSERTPQPSSSLPICHRHRGE